MSSYIEKAESITLPVLALGDTVAFPHIPINFDLPDAKSLAAVNASDAYGSYLFLVAKKESNESDRTENDGGINEKTVYCVGTVAKIKQLMHAPDESVHIIAEGVVRATVVRFRPAGAYVEADLVCKSILLPENGGANGEAVVRELLDTVSANAGYLPSNSNDLIRTASSIKDPGTLADFLAANVLLRTAEKQEILECFDPLLRAQTVLKFLYEEGEILKSGESIRRKVRQRMNRNQREYFLREQIRAIQDELGEKSENDEFEARMKAAKLPREVAEKLKKENDRLAKMPFGSPEATVLANYLDTCLNIPWNESTRDTVDFAAVQKVLDADHNGLEKVKERIVEYIVAKQLNPELRNQIICLVGPPGVGKTSIAASIARAMKRKYVRISLGGVRDEADIRGHRKTYIGSMPGRIINALIQSKVRNPLILLDEIDKLTRDSRGDPTSALLEVLDSEQNKSFRDHFVEIPFDLSDCMFIATANTMDGIPRPLIDRMEIIELGIYTKREKLAIAKDHLIPKQLKRHGMNKRMLKITDNALGEIIDFYTREAGVRNLERTLAALCRKAGKKILADQCRRVVIDAKDVEGYLGARKFLPEAVDAQDEVGVVNGLAYTELGGTLLKVEVAVLEGTGKIETTGSLGDVMKESAHIAVSYVRSIAAKYGIPTDFYKTKDIHIHFPEGAVPKDGPSAGVTMVTALVSALTCRPVRHDVAMTGEISLRGNVLAIGGLREKTMAAYCAGATTVLIPAENEKDLAEIDPMARENLRLIPVRRAEEVLSHALLPLAERGVLRSAEPEKLATPAFLPLSQGQPAGQVCVREG